MPILLGGQLSVALVMILLALVLLLQPELLGADHPYFKHLIVQVLAHSLGQFSSLMRVSSSKTFTFFPACYPNCMHYFVL